MRKFLIALALICLCSACGTPVVREETKEEPIKLRFSFWEPGMYREMENALQKVVDQYEELHPDVSIELISRPVENYEDWIKACVVADDLPEIESSHANTLANQYAAGLVVDITDYMNNPSAYEPEKRWRETFVRKKLNQANIDLQDSLCNIPLFGTEVAFYYNKTVYQELGLTPPKTWREFMHNCEVIQQAEKTPIVFPGQKEAASSWLEWEVGYGSSAKRFLLDPEINVNHDRIITRYEKAQAIARGKWNVAKDASMQKIMKNYISCLEEYFGYCGSMLDLEESIAKAMFINGEAIHINSGVWDAKSFLHNSMVDFEVGTFPMPEFTAEDTDYPGGRTYTNTVQCVAFTKSVYNQEGKLAAAVDFMQYLTSKEVYQQFSDDLMALPVVEGISYDQELETFLADGYLVGDWISNFVIEDMLAGKKITADQEFFDQIAETEKENAMEYLEELGLTEENQYAYSEKQQGGGI